ncbi:MAG: type II toxin-antitoxin system prevent-host-death family antitoxin [Thermoanaerobaculia bacterium]
MSKTNNPDLVRRVAEQKERVVVTYEGREVGALVPIEDLALLREIEDRSDLAEAREALAEIEREGTISWEQVKADLKL